MGPTTFLTVDRVWFMVMASDKTPPECTNPLAAFSEVNKDIAASVESVVEMSQEDADTWAPEPSTVTLFTFKFEPLPERLSNTTFPATLSVIHAATRDPIMPRPPVTNQTPSQGRESPSQGVRLTILPT